MDRILRVFEDLQPVAGIDVFLAGDDSIAGPDEAVIGRESRHLLRRTHIGENEAMRLAHRIGAVEQPLLEPARRRFARGFEDRAVAPEQPAVIAAADARLADQPEFERCAAMRAMQLQQPHGTLAIAKRDQILAEDPQLEPGGLSNRPSSRPAARTAVCIRRTASPGRHGSARYPRAARRGDGNRHSGSSDTGLG